MDELIDILDADGTLTGKRLMKSIAHKEGLFHNSIHVWFYTRKGELLIQKRGKYKDTHPGLWDVSVAGHVGAGEQVVLSAIREVREEIGLAISSKDLDKVGVFKYQHHHPLLVDREFHHTYISELKVPLSALNMQVAEVDDLAMISIKKISTELKNTVTCSYYVPYGPDYYKTIFTAIENKLQ
jgi:isopentenyldiphosphate isomerase